MAAPRRAAFLCGAGAGAALARSSGSAGARRAPLAVPPMLSLFPSCVPAPPCPAAMGSGPAAQARFARARHTAQATRFAENSGVLVHSNCTYLCNRLGAFEPPLWRFSFLGCLAIGRLAAPNAHVPSRGLPFSWRCVGPREQYIRTARCQLVARQPGVRRPARAPAAARAQRPGASPLCSAPPWPGCRRLGRATGGLAGCPARRPLLRWTEAIR